MINEGLKVKDLKYEGKGVFYYINENNITSLNNLDSIIHYIVYGVYIGYNPSNIFNTREYIKNCS